MYGCNNSKKGCLNLKVYRVPKNYKVCVSYTIAPIKVYSRGKRPINLNVKLLECNHSLKLAKASSTLTTRVANEEVEIETECFKVNKIKISCGIVCTRNQLTEVIRVSPNYIFLNKSNNYTDDVYVISNVVWYI